MTRLGLFLFLFFQTVLVIAAAFLAGLVTKLTIIKGTQ